MSTARRRPRTNLKAPGQQPGAFAEVIASLAGDSPVAQQPQQRPAAQRPRQRLPAPQAQLLPSLHCKHLGCAGMSGGSTRYKGCMALAKLPYPYMEMS